MIYKYIHGTPRQQNNKLPPEHHKTKTYQTKIQTRPAMAHGSDLPDPHSTPPLGSTSWRLQPRHTMPSVKVSYKVLVQDEAGGHPRPMLRTVPLPVHEVLKSASSSATVHEPADRESLPSVDDIWGRGPNRGRSQRMGDRWLHP